MKISVVFYLFLLTISTSTLNAQFSQYVDPFIGTDGTGHTFPGAVLPFGMVQLSPDTRNDATWEGASGYHYSDSIIYGFSHTHLSGTGVSDWGDVLIVPQTNDPSIQANEYAQSLSHENETAGAGFYQVTLDNGVDVSLTCSERVGFHQYIFPKEKQKHLLIDLQHRDEVLSSHLKITSPNTIEGSRISKGWAEKQIVYFNIEFSEDFEYEMFLENSSMSDQKLKDNYYGGKNVKSLLKFESDTVKMKVSLSFVSNDGARKNLSEIDHFDFEKVKANAQNTWEKELSRVEIATPFEELKAIFYTALYHSMLHPTLASDIDGQYRGMDQKIYQDTARPHYTVFSLWDTFRASHPLFNLLIPSKNEDFIHSMIRMYDHSGRLPVWELSANETECMIGYHSVSVIADAFAKGKRNFEIEKALSAMISSAETDLYGLPYYREKGFIEAGDEHESVSKTLEYAYDDWCIAQMAKKLGREEIADEFYFRSKSWRHLFDPQSGFIRPRKNGGWEQPFTPENVNLNYTEANAWQYNFFVPHDIQGLIDAYGGRDQFEKKLDEFFNTSSQTSGLNHPDITGLIGQYAHGNEPSHHYALLYNYIGKPWKSQKIIRQILNDFYTTKPDGLIGNDDCGQMSAWYVFNSIGFYPTLPGTPYYDLGSPLFEKVTIHLENGNDLTINAVNAGPEYPYHLNEKNYVLDHYILERGGQFSYTMTDQPKKNLPKNAAIPFHSSVKSSHFIPAPVILRNKEIFKDSAWVEIKKTSNEGTLYYQINQQPKEKYNSRFLIDTNSQITSWVEKGDFKSSEVKAMYYKIPNNWSIELGQEHHTLYNAGGAIGLIDGLNGDENWKKGRWQGYQDTDFTATIDLKKRMRIDSVGASFLQDTRSWIIMPEEIIIETCRKKGKSFKEVARLQLNTPADDYTTTIEKIYADQIRGKIRYVRFTAKNFGALPEWHQGFPYGGKAFIFVDELMVFPQE